MTNKEDQRRRWREIAEQLGIEPGSEPEMEPEPEVEATEPEVEPEPIPEPVMEMEVEEDDRPFELPPDDDLEPFPDEIAVTSSVEESFEEESVESFRDNSTGEDEPLDREMPAGEGVGAPDERGPRRERGGRRRGRRRRGGRSGRDKPVAADATPAEPGAEPALPAAAAEAPNERRPSSRRRGERRDEPRGRSRRGRAPEPIEEEQPQDSFESEAPVEALDSFDDSMDLESPDIAAQDDGEEYADLYSNWTVPSWTELIASLYRPER